MIETPVEVEVYEVEHEASVELDDGTVLRATAPRLADALRILADLVEGAQS